MYAYLYYLSWIFKVWMLVDVYQRRAEGFWFFVILFVPAGEFIYFFVVKLPDFRGMERSLARQFELGQGRSVKAMRQAVAEAPSVVNLLTLATTLYDRKAFEEASALYTQILESHRDELSALHGLGLCLLARDQPQAALEPLRRAVDIEPTFLGNAACRSLIVAEWRSGLREEAVAQLETLVARDGRTQHRAMLGEYLIALGRRDEAKTILAAARTHFEGSPGYVRRTNRTAYRDVRRLLASLEADEGRRSTN